MVYCYSDGGGRFKCGLPDRPFERSGELIGKDSTSREAGEVEYVLLGIFLFRNWTAGSAAETAVVNGTKCHRREISGKEEVEILDWLKMKSHCWQGHIFKRGTVDAFRMAYRQVGVDGYRTKILNSNACLEFRRGDKSDCPDFQELLSLLE